MYFILQLKNVFHITIEKYISYYNWKIYFILQLNNIFYFQCYIFFSVNDERYSGLFLGEPNGGLNNKFYWLAKGEEKDKICEWLTPYFLLRSICNILILIGILKRCWLHHKAKHQLIQESSTVERVKHRKRHNKLL